MKTRADIPSPRDNLEEFFSTHNKNEEQNLDLVKIIHKIKEVAIK